MILAPRFVIAASLLLSAALHAQSFEVAIIKPSDPEKNANSLFLADGKFEARGQTFATLMKFAYGLNTGGSDQQVSGAPRWANSAKFDVDAKEDEQTAAALDNLPGSEQMNQVRLMLRSLLAERFGLRIHHEAKVLPVLALIVAKGGTKMKLAAQKTSASSHDANDWSGTRRIGRGQVEGRNVTMDIFSEVISRQPEVSGRLVVDQTHLPGKYNFMLKWTPESSSGAVDAGADSTAPPFLTALQEQLGLKLESTRASVDTIVVEAAKLPTAN